MGVSSAESDRELVDPESWVDAFGDALFRYALGRIGNRAVAEDLVQETFLAALAARSSFQGRGAALTWLIGILRHKIIDELRRRVSQQQAAGIVGGQQAAGAAGELPMVPVAKEHLRTRIWPGDPREALEEVEFWEVFDSCLTGLPPHLSAAFQLREFEGCETQAICRELEITSANLFVRLHRARLLIRKCIEEKWFCE